MEKEELQSIAFQLITFSGEAFDHFYKSIENARNGHFDEAEKEIALGDKQLTLGHNAQTNLLTAEARSEDIAFSLILIHAQDHLMSTIIYERIAKEFLVLYQERRRSV